MINIYKPFLSDEENGIKVSIKFKMDEEIKILWYLFPKAYKDYIVTERVDGFVIALLFLGLKYGQDIYVNSPFSSKLYYSLNHYLIPAICLANPEFKKIKIIANSLNSDNLNLENISGTGLSCGVDSLSTYYDHIDEIDEYKIKFFTFFNVGSHGSIGGSQSKTLFERRFRRVSQFAKQEHIPIIKIDSNLTEILKSNFQKTHTPRSISCVLLLQKLFKNYYYASSVRFDFFKLDKIRIAEYDILNLHMLSTESTNLFSSVTQLSRIERIDLISKMKRTFKYLDVCLRTNWDGSKINCSKCKKCFQTMIALDTIGKLENYSAVFDINYYYQNKQKLMGELLFLKEKETLEKQLINHLKTENLKRHPFSLFYYGIKSRIGEPKWYKN